MENNIMKKVFFVLAAVLIFSCTAKKNELPQYTIDQFYKNVNVLGNYSFSDDETRLLINTNETGIPRCCSFWIDISRAKRSN
jgi:hypothetical protein